jgi:carbonic anhydrase
MIVALATGLYRRLPVATALLLTCCGTPTASHGPHWGYTGDEGPTRWGDLAPEFSSCKTGTHQSPVDLRAGADKSAPTLALAFAYEPVPLRVRNNGHTLQVDDTSSSAITLGPAPEDRYKLVQLHFHSPSEHTLRGQAFDMEAHLVHKNPAGTLAVVGVWIVKGRESALLARVLENAPGAASDEPRVVGGVAVDLAELVGGNATHFAYAGSLTTPPCTEGVRWFVSQAVHEASDAQIARFVALMHGPNNRPLWPIGTRQVQEQKP